MHKRKSKKRDAIYQTLKNTKSHPTAEWLYRELKAEIPDLSLGTVYRNLAQFRAEGDAVCVATVNGQDRFDGNTAPHAHFVCTMCGAVEDLMDVPAPQAPATGGEVTGWQLSYYGVCAGCKRKKAH